MNKKIIILILLISNGLFAQETLNIDMSLNEAISRAQENSPSYKIALNQAESSYWRFKNYKANFLPQLQLSSVLPNYNRSFGEVTQNDGTIEIIGQENATTSLSLGLKQNLSFIGGQIGIVSSLRRLDNFGENPYHSYSSVPFSITYSQQSVVYNPFKWLKKIEPLRYEESRKLLVEEMENIAIQTTSFYFDLLSSQKAVEIAMSNFANSDTLFKIAKGRYNLGKIAENELLQMELNLLNTENSLNESKLSMTQAKQNFYRFLEISEKENLELQVPQDFGSIEIDPALALSEAENNRSKVIEFRRKRLEAEEAVVKAKSENSLSVDFLANFGYTQTDESIPNVYSNLLDQQQVSLRLNIPLIDWGVSSSRRKMAEANLDLVNNNVHQDELAFEQEVYLQTMRVSMEYNQLKTAGKAKNIAERRYDVTKQRYFIGKITITDLNIAQTEKDQAIRSYYNRLKSYWRAYYTIRRLTLYDFRKGEKIELDMPRF